jgi:alpha-N-arabinofuranosidase
VATTITVDPTARIGTISPHLFGYFVEHLRSGVYGGIFEAGSYLSDAEGFRLDVLEEVRVLGPTQIRYPGGNFVSGYHWRDGVGPRSERPIRFDHVWQAIESKGLSGER